MPVRHHKTNAEETVGVGLCHLPFFFTLVSLTLVLVFVQPDFASAGGHPAVPTAQQLLHGRNLRQLTQPRFEPAPTVRILDARIESYDPNRHQITLQVHLRDHQRSRPQLSVYRMARGAVLGQLYRGRVNADPRGLFNNELRINISHLYYPLDGLEVAIDSCRHHAQCRKIFTTPFQYGDLKVERDFNVENVAGSTGGIHILRTDITNQGPRTSPACSARFRVDGNVVNVVRVPSLAVGRTITIDYRYGQSQRSKSLTVDLPHCVDMIPDNDHYSIQLL